LSHTQFLRGRTVATQLYYLTSTGDLQQMNRYNWSRLNHLQIGKYAEYFVKMEFALWGFDVYSSEVDDRGIDLVVRKDDITYYDVQVKSIRGYNYVFFPKDKFQPRHSLLAAVVILVEGEPPVLYLIPSEAWGEPNVLLADRRYEGKKSKPEWGLNISRKNMPLLEQYKFDRVVKNL